MPNDLTPSPAGPSIASLLEGGQVQPITRWGEPVMHRPTRPVTDFGPAFHAFLRDMFATMTAADGVGLASTQVGDDRSVFVFRCPDADDLVSVGVICNPVVETPAGRSRHLVSDDEGCLSFPGAYAALARPDHAVCRGLDHNGEPVEVTGTGLLARCLQHETDHLGGLVFGDRLSSRRRQELDLRHSQQAYRYATDWPVSPKGAFDPVREAAAEPSAADHG
ncbi:MAG: peptide deformylase [Propionibacteriaceae bacterium]|jgi:peptide deformylase|nr:peptide deformylase [Propionibacteriaceae bacterium]